MVGLRTSGEAIRANFGHQPFKFDIESHVHLQRNATWTNIQSMPTAWNAKSAAFEHVECPTPDTTENVTSQSHETDTREAMEKVVMDYLNHHGYAGTAEAFRLSLAARSTTAAALASSTSSAPGSGGVAPAPPPSDSRVLALSSSADILARQRITASLLSGDIDDVLEVMGDRYPEALTADGGWLGFRLKCRKFVELVLEAAAALKIAKKVAEAAAAAESEVTMKSEKGKAPSLHAAAPMPLSLSTMPMAMPIRKTYSNGRPAAVFEEEEGQDDDNAMDVDMDMDMDGIEGNSMHHQDGELSPIEHFLLHSPPSPSPLPLTRGSFNFGDSTPPAPSAMSILSPVSLTKSLSPAFMPRPLLPISTSSSSPSESPAPSSPIGSMIPLNSAVDLPSGNGTRNGFSSSSYSSSTPSAPKITRAPLFPALPSPPQPRGLITAPPPNASTSPTYTHPTAAFEHIFAYGRQLDADYGADERAHVQTLFQRTSSLVAYENPLEAGGDVSWLAGQEARVELAKAVNEGILGIYSFSFSVEDDADFPSSRSFAGETRQTTLGTNVRPDGRSYRPTRSVGHWRGRFRRLGSRDAQA